MNSPAALCVLGIGGSTRPQSRTLQALKLALRGVTRAGGRATLFDLAKHPLPLFDERYRAEPAPAAAALLLDAVRRADAVLIATPVYHGTPSGAVKNALDYLELLAKEPRPWLQGKAAGLIAAGSGPVPGINALNCLEFACRALRAVTAPTMVAVTDDAFDDGRLRLDTQCAARLLRLGAEVTELACWRAGRTPELRS